MLATILKVELGKNRRSGIGYYEKGMLLSSDNNEKSISDLEMGQSYQSLPSITQTDNQKKNKQLFSRFSSIWNWIVSK